MKLIGCGMLYGVLASLDESFSFYTIRNSWCTFPCFTILSGWFSYSFCFRLLSYDDYASFQTQSISLNPFDWFFTLGLFLFQKYFLDNVPMSCTLNIWCHWSLLCMCHVVVWLIFEPVEHLAFIVVVFLVMQLTLFFLALFFKLVNRFSYY